ncbi:MAG: bifunctional heptose 7-phosphate kinase/heptose 1-phosphate adenyltransferase [Candidatus Zipacnadales bacterium]
MKRERLRSLLDRLPSVSVAVVGDFFLDKYLVIDPALEEFSLETGLPAHQIVAKRCSPGAAGTVTSNLSALGVGSILAVGCIGDDGEGYDLRKGLHATRVDTTHLLVRDDWFTPTYTKPMILQPDGSEVESNRQDIKNRGETPAPIINDLLAELRVAVKKVQAVIVADQVDAPNEGLITDTVRDELAFLADQYPQVIFFADSRGNIARFRNLILKPNAIEAARTMRPDVQEPISLNQAKQAGITLSVRSGKPVYVTLGAKGLLVATPDDATHVPGISVEGPIDIVGAGDSATAGIVSALCAGASLQEAGLIGNLVASITIQQLGTTGTASPEQILARLEEARLEE